jgi:lantibiotic modifying enzyme
VALLLARYHREVQAGRAIAVAGVADLLAGTVRSMRAAEDYRTAQRLAGHQMRPEPPGRYVGLGSQIWCWSQLADTGAVDPDEALRRSVTIAELLPEALAETTESDLLSGRAGAIVTLLELTARTGDKRWGELAVATGEQLVELSMLDGGTARWQSQLQAAGLGGFAHGATGIGWALARLGHAAGRADFTAVADAAFAYEETLWDPAEGSWRDAREETGVATAWCHGATGIGLASADLIECGLLGAADHIDILRRAAEACWRRGMGWNHTVCHGDLGCWELLCRAFALGIGPAGLDQQAVAAYIVSSIDKHGPVSGLARAAFCPGLMPGLGGVAYQLLRMDPLSELPSLLVPA